MNATDCGVPTTNDCVMSGDGVKYTSLVVSWAVTTHCPELVAVTIADDVAFPAEVGGTRCTVQPVLPAAVPKVASRAESTATVTV